MTKITHKWECFDANKINYDGCMLNFIEHVATNCLLNDISQHDISWLNR